MSGITTRLDKMAPLDWMRVRVVGTPECPHQAKWVGRTGVVIMVNAVLPHWATVRLDRQVKQRQFLTKHLEVLGPAPSRALLLATGDYVEDNAIVSPSPCPVCKSNPCADGCTGVSS